MLNAEQDGIEQMRAVLAQYANLDSIQIVSHGSPGTLSLGSSTLDHESLDRYADSLATIGTSLGETGDLLL